MLVFLTITFVIAWAWQTWRKHVWKRRYYMVLHPHVMAAVGEWSKLWAEGFRDAQRADDWPDEVESKYDA